MKATIASAILLALCACTNQPKAVQACEALLTPSLKAPSTYKLIDATASKSKDGSTDVFIQYDAVNSYNAPIRGTFACKVDAAGVASNAEIDADRDIEEAVGNSLGTRPADKPADQPKREQATDLDEVPVCDRPDSPAKSALMNEIGTDCMGE